MCLYYLFRYKKMNELERNPKKYIETLFHFLEEQDFQKSYHQVNGEECINYEKDNFHVGIDYDCYMKMKYVNFYLYYKTWDNDDVIKHLYIKDEQYKLRFQDYNYMNCKEKLDLVAEYLSEHLEDVLQDNVDKSKY